MFVKDRIPELTQGYVWLSPFAVHLNNHNLVNWLCMLSCFSCVGLFATPSSVACQALMSMEYSRQEYWSGLPLAIPQYKMFSVFKISFRLIKIRSPRFKPLAFES